MAMDAGGFLIGAQIFEAAAAPLALAAGVGLPAESDALSYLERADLGTDGADGADDFVPGDERVLADAPVVGNEMKIAMTNTAVGDADFDFLRAQFTWVVSKRQKLGACCVSC